MYSTVEDFASFWDALFNGRIVPRGWVARMVRPRSDVPRLSRRYGLGFWLRKTTGLPLLEGYDAGVSFCSVHDDERQITHTVMSNTSEGAWPMTQLLADRLETATD
jgi:hypothetical protein